ATTAGLDPDIQFAGKEFDASPLAQEEPAYWVYPCTGTTQALIQALLLDCHFTPDFQDLERDSLLVANEIETQAQEITGSRQIVRLDVAEPVFYRGKGAYLVGRACTPNAYIPMGIALSNNEQGIYVDAVLLTEDEVSIVF